MRFCPIAFIGSLLLAIVVIEFLQLMVMLW